MSRVNLDEQVFGERRLHRLAALMGWSTRETLGTLAYLWHESQSARRVSGTASEIKNWAWVDDPTIGELLISSLETVGYIHGDGDEFIIHGNDAHIERLAHYAANASKGGKSKNKMGSKSKASAKQPLSNRLASAKQPLSNGQALHNSTLQCSSVQCSSEHLNAEQGTGGTTIPPAPPAVPKAGRKATPKTEGSRIWLAYESAYEKTYGHPPVRNAKMNALCTQLVKRLGAEDAEKVVQFYLTHRKSYYVGRVHALESCVHDAEALRTQMLAGHRITTADAKRVDDGQTNEQVFASVAAKLKREGVIQ